MILVLPALFAGAWSSPVAAQNSDEFPFSIMQPEPGERRAGRPKSAPKQVTPAPRVETPQSAQKAGPRPIRRGSSSASAIPVYRSPVTPLGTAPQVGNVQPLGNPGSPSVTVPGIQSNTGPAMIPAAPARTEQPGPHHKLRAFRRREWCLARSDRQLHPKLRQSLTLSLAR